MKHVPPELDSLMWTLAEERNERAIDEFGNRHPELRSELVHRINMVKGLRGAKNGDSKVVREIPRFVPKDARPTKVKAQGPTFVIGGLVLAAIAAAAYTITTLLAPEPRLHPGDVTVVHQTPVSAPPTNNTITPPAPNTIQQPPPVNLKPLSEPDPVVTGLTAEAAKKPQILRVDGSPLLTVIDMMGQISGTKIMAAPGMPNPMVQVDYQGLTTMQMLQDLGHKYGFTPLDQHDGSILVVPAVDKNSANGQTLDPLAIPSHKNRG